MKYPGTITLATPRLVLRRYTMADVDAMYENWASDPEVTRFLTWEPHPDKDVTRAVLEVWTGQYQNDYFFHWGIEKDGELIGDIAVTEGDRKNEHAELGYCLSRAYWGQGLMTEALERVLRFMFEEMNAHRVYLRHDVQNVGSGRVMQKCGMTYEGTLREHHLRSDGSWADHALYGILRGEWQGAR